MASTQQRTLIFMDESNGESVSMPNMHAAACNACHRSHKRCDGQYPNTCSRCMQKGLECIYEAPKKRGPKQSRKRDRDEAAAEPVSVLAVSTATAEAKQSAAYQFSQPETYSSSDSIEDSLALLLAGGDVQPSASKRQRMTANPADISTVESVASSSASQSSSYIPDGPLQDQWIEMIMCNAIGLACGSNGPLVLQQQEQSGESPHPESASPVQSSLYSTPPPQNEYTRSPASVGMTTPVRLPDLTPAPLAPPVLPLPRYQPALPTSTFQTLYGVSREALLKKVELLQSFERMGSAAMASPQYRPLINDARLSITSVFFLGVSCNQLIQKENIERSILRAQEIEVAWHSARNNGIDPTTTGLLNPATSPDHLLLDVVMGFAMQRMEARQHLQYFFSRAKQTAASLLETPTWESAAALIHLGILCFTEGEGSKMSMYNKIALGYAEELSTFHDDKLYLVAKCLNVHGEVSKRAMAMDHMTVDAHLIEDHTQDVQQSEKFGRISSSVFNQMLTKDVSEWFQETEKLIISRTISRDYEDLACTTHLLCCLGNVLYSRHLVDLQQKHTMLCESLAKLQLIEDYLNSPQCPRIPRPGGEDKTYQFFIIRIIRAEIFLRMGAFAQAKQQVESATLLTALPGNGFFKSPPTIAMYTPLMVAQLLRLNSPTLLKQSIEVLDIVRRTFPLLDITLNSLAKVLAKSQSS